MKGSKRGDIEVIFDNTRSATTNYVVDSVLHGAKMGAKIMAAKTSKEVIDYVDQNPGSIGVIGSNWLNDRRDSTNTTFKKNIHVMRVSIKDVAAKFGVHFTVVKVGNNTKAILKHTPSKMSIC